MFGANRAPISHQDQHYLQIDQNELPLEPRHLGLPTGVSKMITETYGMLRAICAPIFHQH